MPLYEYRCEKCGAVSEYNMKMSDPHPEICPKCNEGPLTKLMSTTAFHLKGGGWYNQGYDGKSNQKAKPEKSKSESNSKSSESSKSSDSSKSKSE